MNILGIDTETGGLKVGHHSLLQVALVAYKQGKVVDTLDLFVREDEYVVTPKAMEINQLDLGYVQEKGVRPAEVVETIIGFVQLNYGKEAPILLGHNVGFDKAMLKNLFETENQNMDRYISHRSIDTMSILWTLHDLGLVPREACSSTGAFEHFDIELKRAHNAFDDIMATMELYNKLKAMIAK